MPRKKASVAYNPKGVGNDEEPFGESSRAVAGQDPLFPDTDAVKAFLTDTKALEFIQVFANAVKEFHCIIGVGSSKLRKKGNYFVQINQPLNIQLTVKGLDITYTFDQMWNIEVDLWGAVRGHRVYYPSIDSIKNEEPVYFNDPTDPNSLVYYMEEQDDLDGIRKEMEEALKAILYTFVTSSSQELTYIAAELLPNRGVMTQAPT